MNGAHRIGNRYVNGERRTKRTIVAKFLNFKDKQLILTNYRDRKLWENGIYIKEDFSDVTVKKRKALFLEEKALREQGYFAKVSYNKLIKYNNRKPQSIEGNVEIPS